MKLWGKLRRRRRPTYRGYAAADLEATFKALVAESERDAS